MASWNFNSRSEKTINNKFEESCYWPDALSVMIAKWFGLAGDIALLNFYFALIFRLRGGRGCQGSLR